MVRFVIIGIVIAVAFTLYALVDAAMTDGARARGVSKPVWILLVVLLPVVGGILWFLVGKGAPRTARQPAPDDDPRFAGTRMSSDDLDVHMRDLEARLRELDAETFPGERGAGGADPGSEATSEPRPAGDGTAPARDGGIDSHAPDGDAGGPDESAPDAPATGDADGSGTPRQPGDGDGAQPR